jgi:membrane-associated phospholipid phosphatase
MNKYLSIIGYQGPNTLLLLILFMIATSKTEKDPLYFCALIVAWQFASHLLNVAIKLVLKAPRPDSHKDPQFPHLKPTLKNFLIIHRNYGMPSGHAQAVISELTFIAMYFQKPLFTAIAAAQAALTLYQRYTTRRHSLKQLLMGSLLGIAVGVVGYKSRHQLAQINISQYQ